MTPSGISAEDWDEIVQLAWSIAISDDDEPYRLALFRALDKLEEKYGVLPDLLATRADYVEIEESVSLLSRAFVLATEKRDFRNQTLIADSLAQIYIRTLSDPNQGRTWLTRLRACIERCGTEDDLSTFRDLSRELDELESHQ
jgi:hypothetical protein